MVFVCTSLMILFAILWVITFITKLAGGNNILANTFVPKGEKATKEEIVKVFLYVLLFRIGIYIVGVVISMMFSEEIGFTFSDFLSSWNRWDSQHYIDLASKGYADCVENGQHLFLVFFPLCPWLLKIIHFIIRDWQFAFIMLSTIAYCVGAVFFYICISEEYGKKTAQRALTLVSVWPFAFFFGGMMTESLFFATLSIGFYFIKKHNWFAVGLTGLFCSLCRVQGILLLGVAGVEFLQTYSPVIMWKEKKIALFFKEVFTKGMYLLLIPVGNLIYFYLNYKVEGNPGEIMKYHNIHVVYTREAETADHYIEKTVRRIAKEHDVIVATSDALEQVIIMGQGAHRMSAAGLKEEIESVIEQMKDDYPKQEELIRNYLFDYLEKDIAEEMERVRLGSHKKKWTV